MMVWWRYGGGMVAYYSTTTACTLFPTLIINFTMPDLDMISYVPTCLLDG